MNKETNTTETAIDTNRVLTPVIIEFPEMPAISDGNYWIVEAIRHHFWTHIVYSKDDITIKKNKGNETVPFDWSNARRIPIGKKLVSNQSFSGMYSPFTYLGPLRYLPNHL